MEGEPRYLAATFASSLSEDHSVELDRIRSAFTSAGFVAMSKLPSEMRYSSRAQLRSCERCSVTNALDCAGQGR